MIRVIVVDDEPLARSGIVTRLSGHADIEVVGQYGDGIAALDAIAARAPDLVFLDIEMPGMNGLDVLATLPPQQRPVTILLTAYDRFAVQAYSLNVTDYLLKPVDDERFAEAVHRARLAISFRQRLEQDAVQAAQPEYVGSFAVRQGHRTIFVDAGAVQWIEANGDYANLYVGDKQHLVRESLHRLAQTLDPARFIRVHRSAIVRIDQIEEMVALSNRDAMLRLRDGTPVRASRTYIEQLAQALKLARP
jgi:two-component system, LytTR family, response regulator